MDPVSASSSNSSNDTAPGQGAVGAPAPTEHLNSQEFLQTGRTGRRNALPDILSEQHAHVATADLAAKMQSLSTGTEPSSSGSSDGGPGPSSASN